MDAVTSSYTRSLLDDHHPWVPATHPGPGKRITPRVRGARDCRQRVGPFTPALSPSGSRKHGQRGNARRSYHAKVLERCIDDSSFLRRHFANPATTSLLSVGT